MNLLHAFLLGIVQGLTEFIPVSSTAHLLVSQSIFEIPADDAMFSFLVIVQLGTLVSLFAFYWQDLLLIAKATLHFRRSTPERDLGFYIIIATIPALIAGYLLSRAAEERGDGPPKVKTSDALRLAVGIIGLVRGIAALGNPD